MFMLEYLRKHKKEIVFTALQLLTTHERTAMLTSDFSVGHSRGGTHEMSKLATRSRE